MDLSDRATIPVPHEQNSFSVSVAGRDCLLQGRCFQYST